MKEKLRIPKGAEGFIVQVGSRSGRFHSHRHEELEVNLVLHGRASYLFGTRRVPLLPGSMIWLFPRQEHVLIDWSPDFLMWVVVFKPGLVTKHTAIGPRRLLRAKDPRAIFCRQIDSRHVEVLNYIFQSAALAETDLDLLNATLGYALIQSWQAYGLSAEPAARTDVHPAVARAARLLENAKEHLSLVELSRKSGLSPARLSRLFKQQTGVPLTKFRQRKGIERFLRIYQRGTRYSLIEAALLAGFGSYPQFHRVFCRLLGVNPAGYRAKLRADIASAQPNATK